MARVPRKEELNKKREFEAAQRDIKKKIEVGDVSLKEGMRWLNEIRKELWGEELRELREEPDREAYNREARKLKAAVEAGEISKREAEERFREMQRRIRENEDKHDHGDEEDNEGDE